MIATDDPNLSSKHWTYNVQYSLRSHTGAIITSPISKNIEVFGGQVHDLAKSLPAVSQTVVSIPTMEAAVLRAEAAASIVTNTEDFIDQMVSSSFSDTSSLTRQTLDSIHKTNMESLSVVKVDIDGRPYFENVANPFGLVQIDTDGRPYFNY